MLKTSAEEFDSKNNDPRPYTELKKCRTHFFYYRGVISGFKFNIILQRGIKTPKTRLLVS